MTRDPEEAGDSLLEELMTVFADPYVDKLTYIAAMEIAGLGEKVASLEDALASITRERDAMREALVEARDTIARHQQELSAALVKEGE